MERNIIAVIIHIALIPLLFSQNTISRYLVDKDIKAPLQSATIHNVNDYTTINVDEYFVFYSTNDSITIEMLGYEIFKTTFKTLSYTKDTLYLIPKPFQLDEVTLSNRNILQEAYNRASISYPMEPSAEDFFLRCVFKRNGEFVKTEDLDGCIKRDKLLSIKKDSTFQLFDMRKFDIEKEGMRADDFDLPLLDDVFQ